MRAPPNGIFGGVVRCCSVLDTGIPCRLGGKPYGCRTVCNRHGEKGREVPGSVGQCGTVAHVAHCWGRWARVVGKRRYGCWRAQSRFCEWCNEFRGGRIDSCPDFPDHKGGEEENGGAAASYDSENVGKRDLKLVIHEGIAKPDIERAPLSCPPSGQTMGSHGHVGKRGAIREQRYIAQ